MATPPKRSLVGAVLVGGRSERMGLSKADLPLPDGRTFAQAVAHTLAGVCDDVVVLGGAAPFVVGPVSLDGAPLAVLPDDEAGAGPLAGVLALLESGRARRYLVAACDAPLLPAGLVRELVDVEGPAACFARGGDRLAPLPCLLDEALAPLARARLLGGRRSLEGLLEEAPAVVLEDPGGLLAEQLKGVNTPDELEVLYERIRSGAV